MQFTRICEWNERVLLSELNFTDGTRPHAIKQVHGGHPIPMSVLLQSFRALNYNKHFNYILIKLGYRYSFGYTCGSSITITNYERKKAATMVITIV